MNGDIEAHELPEVLVGESELVGEVGSIVERGVSISDLGVVAVLVGVNDGADAGHLGAEVQAIFEGRDPVFALVDAIMVRLHEVGAGLAGEHTRRELSHSVHILRQRLDKSLFFGSQLTSSVQLLFEVLDFRFGGVFTSEEQPQDTFGDGFTSSDSLGSILSDVEQGSSSVGDTFGGVEFTGLVEHAGHASHASEDLSDGDLTNDCISVFLAEGHGFLLSFGDHVLHLLVEGRGKGTDLVLLARDGSSALHNILHHVFLVVKNSLSF